MQQLIQRLKRINKKQFGSFENFDLNMEKRSFSGIRAIICSQVFGNIWLI